MIEAVVYGSEYATPSITTVQLPADSPVSLNVTANVSGAGGADPNETLTLGDASDTSPKLGVAVWLFVSLTE